MSALDLDATIRRCIAALLEASYVDDIPSVTTDRWRWVAADASRDLGALITRLRAAEARTAWQPIETAPRDGTLVLAWHPWWMGPDAVRCGRSGVWTADGHPVCEPTHWMPLPAAPEAGHG